MSGTFSTRDLTHILGSPSTNILAFIGSHAAKVIAALTVPFCGTVLYFNNDQSEFLDSVPDSNNFEEDVIMENDLDKVQDHKIDEDFLDLIVKNYRHMKRVESDIFILH